MDIAPVYGGFGGPVMSELDVVVILVLAAIGFILAAPHLRNTTVGHFFNNECVGPENAGNCIFPFSERLTWDR
jgi:hypothetical protein